MHLETLAKFLCYVSSYGITREGLDVRCTVHLPLDCSRHRDLLQGTVDAVPGLKA